MSVQERTVSSTAELLEAANNRSVSRIRVAQTLTDVRSMRLLPGQELMPADRDVALIFASGEDGLQVSADNLVKGLELRVEPHRRALFNDASVERLGSLAFSDLRISGLVEVLANGPARSGHVEAARVEIVAADAASVEPRTKGYGVEVVVGAFTVWNRNAEGTLTADLTDIRVGRPGRPVRGSGVFVSGAGPEGGRLVVSRLETGAVHCDGG